MAKYLSEDLENKATQLRKGILELATMAALYHQPHYGYSLVRVLTAESTLDIKEGTIYPILARLAKDGLVRSAWVESNQGPPRKYYELTGQGQKLYEALHAEFHKLIDLVAAAAKTVPVPDEEPVFKKIRIKRSTDE
jgi:PadR family transcriptional regulator PadR